VNEEKDSTIQAGRFSRPDRRFTIGLLTAEAFMHYAPGHWLGVIDAAQERDVNVICFLGENLQAPKGFHPNVNAVSDVSKTLDSPRGFHSQATSIFELASSGTLDGLIVWASVLNWFVDIDTMVDFCKRYQLPVVSAEVPLTGIPSVLIGDYPGMYSVVSHLIEAHGHRRIAFLRGPENHVGARERYRGYMTALADHGLALDPGLVTSPISWDGKAGARVLLDERGLQPRIDFDALVGANDGLVTGVHAIFEERGILVPDQVAVAGFDNTPELGVYMPPYTTVDPQVYRVGRQALELLLSLLHGASAPESITVPARLIVRRSCGCAERAVIQAGAARLPAARLPTWSGASPPLADVLAAGREEILSEIVQASGVAREQAARFVDAFSDGLEHSAPELFLTPLETLLHEQGTISGDAAPWHDALSALRRALHHFGGARVSSDIETLWQQGRVLIGETARRAQAYRMMRAEQQLQMLREVEAALLDSYDVHELADVLAQSLPHLGIPSAYLALYEQSWSVSEWSRLILACGESGRIELDAEGRRFRSRQLAPEGILPQDRRYSLVAEPLYFRERHLGFVLLEVGPHESIVYETLREGISHGLYGDWLLRERHSAEEVLRRHAVEHEIHEREQRRRATLERVVRMGKAITQVTDLRTCLLNIRNSVQHELDFDRVGLFLYDAEDNVMRGTYGTDVTGALTEEWDFVIPVATYGPYQVLLREPDSIMFANDFVAENKPPPEHRMSGVKQHVTAAVWAGDRLIAMLGVDNLLTGSPITEEQVEALRLFSRYAGLAIENARLLEQARQAEQKYRSIFENSIEGISQTTLEGRFLNANPAQARIMGYASPEELIASMTDIQHELYVDPERRDELKRLLEEQGVARDFEFQLRRKDGHLAWVSLNAHLVRSGQRPYIEGTLQDITERRQLEAQLLKAQKMEAIGQLAGGIAHDFNNLLVVIVGSADLASAALAADNPVLADLQEIQNAAARAANLTRQLLTFARRQVTTPRILSLNDLILETDKLLRRLIRENITIHTLPAPDLWPVQADAGQIEQVIVNLAVNARDAMPQGGTLTIETANTLLDEEYARTHPTVTPGPYILLAMTDTGVGMSAEVLRHAFEPFFTTKEQGQGTGLGLATCYGIVSQHGGSIQLYSEVGRGTSVKVYLPRAKDTALAPAGSQEYGQVPRGTETVLLAEDEPAVRRLAARMLHRQGYTVLEAANGVEALEIVESYTGAPIDLLLTDMVMPKMGGYELAEQLRQRIPNICVLFMSGYTDNAVVQNGLLDPSVTFIQKPFTPAALARRVRAVLDR
jgi:PAS domain S-box-containing protein